MEESEDPWIVIASEGDDRIYDCTCCGAIRIDFGNVRVQITRENLVRLAQLVRRMARDVTTRLTAEEEGKRDISISFGQQKFLLRLTVEELGRFRLLLSTAWRQIYRSGGASWPDDQIN